MKYFGHFTCAADVARDFSDVADDGYTSKNDIVIKEDEILLASYGGRDYEGAAIVIFVRDEKYYEVHGSHCSCNGLEGQWSPEETSMEALLYRLENMDEYSRRDLIEEHGQDFYDAFLGLTMFELFEKKVLLS